MRAALKPPANEELARDAKKLNLTLQVETCDVTAFDQVRAVITKTVSQFGGLDIIVNAAAIHPFGTVLQTDLDTWNRCMMVNVGSIYLARASRYSGDEEARRRIHSQSWRRFKVTHASEAWPRMPRPKAQFTA